MLQQCEIVTYIYVFNNAIVFLASMLLNYTPLVAQIFDIMLAALNDGKNVNLCSGAATRKP